MPRSRWTATCRSTAIICPTGTLMHTLPCDADRRALTAPRTSGQRHQRKVDGIPVVAEVEHLRKTGAGELALAPRRRRPPAGRRAIARPAATARRIVRGRRRRGPRRPRRSATPSARPRRRALDRRSSRASRPSRRRAADGARASRRRDDTAGSSAREAHRPQPLDRLPGAVDVVDAPAAIPRAVGLLLTAAGRPRRDRPTDARCRRPSLPNASSTRPARSGELGSIIALWSANGTLQSNSQLLSRSKAPQPPSQFCIASSQGTRPADRRDPIEPSVAARPASRRGRDSRHVGQRDHHHRRVVDVGVEAVGILEAPAGRLGPAAAATSRPPCGSRGEQPVDGLAHAGRRPGPAAAPAEPLPTRRARRSVIAVSHTGERQGSSRVVPSASSSTSRSSCRQHSVHLGRVVRAAHRPQGDDAPDDRREDRPQAVAAVEPLEHPAAARRDRPAAERPEADRIAGLDDAGRRRGRSAAQTLVVGRRPAAAARSGEQLGDAAIRQDSPHRLEGPHQRQRHDHRPRPGRHAVRGSPGTSRAAAPSPAARPDTRRRASGPSSAR